MPSFLHEAVSAVIRRIAQEVKGVPGREAVIKGVLPKLFPGYKVRELIFEEGYIKVSFEPIFPLVDKVFLSFSPERFPPEIEPLYKVPYEKLGNKVVSLFQGLPVESLDWVQEVASLEVKKEISALLPGYSAYLSLIFLPEALLVKVSLRGEDPVVLSVDLVLRSRTVPNIVLRGLRKEFLPNVKLMEGLPIAFVKHHEKFFKDLVVKRASLSKALTFYRVDLSPELYLGRISTMVVSLESRVWSIIAEGRIPVGLKDAEPEGVLHFGKVFKEGEVYVEVKALLESIKLESFLGIELRVGPKLWIGYKRSFSEGENFFFLRYSNFQAGYWDEDGGIELSYSYWFGSWVRVEFTYSTHEDERFFLRVVGRL
ncbi:MAG: hypothetical protein NZ900_09350 [Synergistetes bacterium]|nr:hypothetical protein [Synergistota bacterium]MDW8193122.1 hypothetical protein [Synergistota bacterium]